LQSEYRKGEGDALFASVIRCVEMRIRPSFHATEAASYLPVIAAQAALTESGRIGLGDPGPIALSDSERLPGTRTTRHDRDGELVVS
jgi:hypothetical protein